MGNHDHGRPGAAFRTAKSRMCSFLARWGKWMFVLFDRHFSPLTHLVYAFISRFSTSSNTSAPRDSVGEDAWHSWKAFDICHMEQDTYSFVYSLLPIAYSRWSNFHFQDHYRLFQFPMESMFSHQTLSGLCGHAYKFHQHLYFTRRSLHAFSVRSVSFWNRQCRDRRCIIDEIL